MDIRRRLHIPGQPEFPVSRRDLLLSAIGAASCVAARSAFGQAGDDILTSWLQRWIAAFNDPDLNVYRRFVESFAPSAAPYLDDDLGVREITGGLDLLRSEVTGSGEITAWVKDRLWDRHSRVVLTAATRDRLNDIAFASAPSAARVERLSEPRAMA